MTYLPAVHGNGGTIVQGWRTDTYRAVASGAPDKIHVLTVDYRGFGYSTGSPTERGVIDDGIALVNWALNTARIPPNRIVILGQSLGTAVASAVAEDFISKHQVEFSGVVLVAPFTNIATLVLSYSIGGIIPILSPLKPYPILQSFFAKQIQETWKTDERLATLVRKSNSLDLTLIHSRDDFDIPWQHSELLFQIAANATSERGLSAQQINNLKMHQESSGEAGCCWTDTWTTAGKTKGNEKVVRLRVVRHGGGLPSAHPSSSYLKEKNLTLLYPGHNRLVTYPAVAAAVLKAFKMR